MLKNLLAVHTDLRANSHQNKNGFSFIEVIIVVAIIAVLFIIVMSQAGYGQLDRARDAKRKDNLKRIGDAFEEYYNDNDHYPPQGILNNCGGPELQPYLNQVPCDPDDGSAYMYRPYPDGSSKPSAYRIYAALERGKSDQAVRDLGCFNGCVVVPPVPAKYNYGVAQGVPVSN